MKFVVSGESLKKAMRFLAEIVSRKTTIPSLGCVLLSVSGGRLDIFASDLFFSAKISTSATVAEEGRALINAKKLEDVSKSAEGGVLFQSMDNHWVTLKSGSAKFKLPGLDPAQAPAWRGAEINDPKAVEVPAQDFLRAIESVIFAIPDKQSRFTVDGFLIKDGDFVSTDGYRMPIFWAEWAGGIPEVIIPRRAGYLLRDILRETSGKISISQSESEIVFSSPNGAWEFCSPKVHGQFPDFKSMLPKEEDFKVRATFNSIVFAEHLQRVGVCGPDDKKVSLVFSEGRVVFESSSAMNGEAVDEMAINGGSDLKISFNGSWLLEIMKIMAGEVEFAASTPSGAAVIRKGADYQVVIMPMRGE
jgi:DNA polymerase-3 subunit beta